MAAIAGLRGTGDFGTDERPKDFREGILRLRPNGNAPIFALTSKAKSRSVTDPEFFWWTETDTNVRLQVNGALVAGDTTIVVDSADPTATTLDANYGTALNLKEGDILQVEKTEVAAMDNELLLVTDVLSATSFTVSRGFAGSTAAAIADDAFLTLIGSAYAEGTGAPAAASRNPVQYTNKCQIFKDTYELTGTTVETEFRTGNPWSEDKMRKMFDHSRAIEWAILYGQRSETTTTINGKPLRTMGGLRQFIPSTRTTVFAVATTIATFNAAIFKAFDFESDAGDERIAMCGNGALNVLNNLVNADANSDVQYDGPVTVYGMNLRKYVLPQGTIFLRTHPLLNQHARYTNSMFILDFSALRYVSMRNRDTKVTDDVQNKDEDVRRGFIMTDCSIQVDNGGLSMAYLGNVN